MTDFKKYSTPKDAIFRIPDLSRPYDADGNGWPSKQEKMRIIGEEKLHYITHFTPGGVGVGPHKSRLIRWVDTQLTLF